MNLHSAAANSDSVPADQDMESPNPLLLPVSRQGDTMIVCLDGITERSC